MIGVDNEMVYDIFIVVVQLLAVRPPHAQRGKWSFGHVGSRDSEGARVEAHIIGQRVRHDT